MSGIWLTWGSSLKRISYTSVHASVGSPIPLFPFCTPEPSSRKKGNPHSSHTALRVEWKRRREKSSTTLALFHLHYVALRPLTSCFKNLISSRTWDLPAAIYAYWFLEDEKKNDYVSKCNETYKQTTKSGPTIPLTKESIQFRSRQPPRPLQKKVISVW